MFAVLNFCVSPVSISSTVTVASILESISAFIILTVSTFSTFFLISFTSSVIVSFSFSIIGGSNSS